MARRRNKKKKQEEETLVDVVGQVETLQDYVEHNRSRIMTILGVIALLVAAGVAYFYFYKGPKEAKAAEVIQFAQAAFDRDNFPIALDGDTINTDQGFLDIIDNFSGTEAANLSNYYAGICYLNLGNYDAATSFLNDYSPKGRILGSFKHAALGDAYSELGQMDKALSSYRKATSTDKNEFSTPLHMMKLGLFLENQGNTAEAKETYAKISKDYPNSPEATDAEKYLARLGGQ